MLCEDSAILDKAIAAMLLGGLSQEELAVVLACQAEELDRYLSDRSGSINAAKLRISRDLEEGAEDGRQLSRLFKSSILFLQDVMNGQTPEEERLERDFDPIEKTVMCDRISAANAVIRLKLKLDPSSASKDIDNIPSPNIKTKKQVRTWAYEEEG